MRTAILTCDLQYKFIVGPVKPGTVVQYSSNDPSLTFCKAFDLHGVFLFWADKSKLIDIPEDISEKTLNKLRCLAVRK